MARFKVSNGSKIVVDPEPDSDTASMRVYLLGSCLGAMLFQRGLLVLHGNAIEIDGKCMICVGPSGVGKSTLTAAFLQRGFRVLADDVVPIDPSRNAIPGYPRIKLWQDVADKLGIETKKLDEIRPGMKKYNYPLGTAFCDKPIPVGMICLLSPHAKDTIEVTRVQGMDRFSALYGNTYRQQFVEGMGLQSAHLRQCGELGARTSILRVSRPTSGFRIEALMQCLLEAMREIA
ncbi:hypothetical protein [Novosphingobium beihaiensis]|uniref:HPr kinase/phosphorylase C-terminal domain-containing protein n=1 Tax=Novosphingobium beihaiensis TaxID=2930389 RepID=A0ABT0BW30_9SPHN|nr:hypothetical protein [Novosphingobium beihaiensis]MCJ2189195.1 hypothetical protein [Novosphingobium beihaiensis]